jgi:hypothetical protein
MNIPAIAHATIKVEVDFYDDAEKKKLLAYPTASEMQTLVAKPLEIPQAEFLTYYLFHRIKLGTEGYRDYKSVARKVHKWLDAIGECIDYEDGSVHTPQGASQQLTEVSEHVGEAIGLAVMNRIHGLTEADWAPITEQRGRSAKPSFDFQIASDGRQFVQVETKGSSVADNRVLSDAVKAQKKRIDDKKAKLAALALKGDDPNPAGLRYGTIAVVDGRKDGNVRCLITDPPPDVIEDDPKRFRLLNRMRSLRDWISFLSPRSAFAAALATRVADLEVLRDPFELDSVPILRGTGEPFGYEPFSRSNWRHSSFMWSKSRVTDEPVGGVVVQLSERELFFIGVREELLLMASNQNFEDVASYKTEIESRRLRVECMFSAGRFRNLDLPASVKQTATTTGAYVHFPLSGTLNFSREGFVFGVLPLPDK